MMNSTWGGGHGLNSIQKLDLFMFVSIRDATNFTTFTDFSIEKTICWNDFDEHYNSKLPTIYIVDQLQIEREEISQIIMFVMS